jgi:pyruvate dehydrogenase E1 component alpha subunit
VSDGVGISGALGLKQVLDADGSLLGAMSELVDVELIRSLYRHLHRVRRIDTRMIQLQRQGRIGFYGAASGEEAAPVAAGLALAEEDWVFPALRESAVLLVRGQPLDIFLAQLFGNSRDVLKGRQMPSHQASRRFRQVSWSSCIGTQLPHAVGAALAARRLGRSDVMLAFLGDGATSHPDFHAALNFAGVFRAGVVFVCQNNQYAISLPSARQTAAPTFAAKAPSYGVAAERVDGNDVLAVYDVIRRAVAAARAGGGPTFIECVTYRIGPHSSSDEPSRYRDDEEVERWRALDPLLRVERHLSRLGSAPDLGELDAAVDVEVDRALAAVESLPAPPPASLFEDVYETLPWFLREQRSALL